MLRRAATDISFSVKERVGTDYLRSLFPVHQAVDQAVARGAYPSDMSSRLQALAKAGERHDETLESFSQRHSAIVAAQLDGRRDNFAAMDEAQARLFLTIGNSSNLILDPDLDTYYLMTIVVERLPVLTRQAAQIFGLIRETQAASGISRARSDQLAILITNFSAGERQVAAAAKLARSNTKNAQIGEAVTSVGDAFANEVSIFDDIAKEAFRQLRSNSGTYDLSALANLEPRFNAAAKAFYDVSLHSLDTLLETRIDGFKSSRNFDLAMIFMVGLLAYLIGYVIVRHLLSSLRFLRAEFERMAKGGLGDEVAASWLNRPDETGAIARAANRLRLSVVNELTQSFSAEKASAVRDEQKRALSGMATELDHAISGSVRAIDNLGGEVSQSAAFVSHSTTSTREAITESVAELDKSVAGIRHATNSLNELGMAVGEIADQAARAADASRIARESAGTARSHSSELDRAVADIKASAKLVETIAAQTNLLALNATIEAARAGEAGRGFAVVAQEVKQLAAQSAQATAEIQQRIGSILQVTGSVVGAIEKMGETIDRVDEASLSIASAVEQHNVTTAEITQRVEETANRAENVARQITDISLMADSTDDVAVKLKSLAEHLSAEANSLRKESERFMNRIAA
ncbi:MAG: methyl-accepting chemotaxis protein [Bosea sp. (in: a-proteobacteria)]